MSHIHTAPGQHDLTVSAYVLRWVDGEWKCLVHMHKKLHKLLQVGGHVELNETPWQALEHELREEAGYILGELEILQPSAQVPQAPDNVAHPIPARFMTHLFSEGHYHTDLGFAFIASAPPKGRPSKGESDDVRWLTLAEMEQAKQAGEIIPDVIINYRAIVDEIVPKYAQMPANAFSLGHPQVLPTEQQ